MRKIIKIIIRALICFVSIICAILVGCGIYMYILYTNADFKEPDVTVDKSQYNVEVLTDSLRICGDGRLQLNKYGIWEAKVGGSPVEIGSTLGAMSKDILYYQEEAFIEQINNIIPSEGYLNFLKYLVVIFNRDMASHIPQEFREEIFSISEYCSDDFDVIGPAYIRQLNYHAAHDIGHAMQEYMLVGCTSFGVWGQRSKDSKLIVGRNFDFYVGDDFAKNKMALFVSPDKGYKYASITWPGMVGVLSGMNENGLTVTINAAKGPLPTSSALPISLLARQILQYAKNIEEAYSIASSAKTFVSESLLIGSSEDGCAAIIEKTPDSIALYRSEGEDIKCTNHYQSEMYENDEYNVENIAVSDSKYRLDRLAELIDSHSPISEKEAVEILRDRYGVGNTDIGFTNQKSINLYIAHHSVVFKPEELKMWVSTSPWQSGEYICYDLNDVFNDSINAANGYSNDTLIIGEDEQFMENEYTKVLKYRGIVRQMRHAIDDKVELNDTVINNAIALNPNYYEVYDLCGDYMNTFGRKEEGRKLWETALTKEIPYTTTVDNIKEKLKQ